MTREEAIDIFEHNWTRLENHDYTEKELNEALDMAIKALKQEPCEDAISRQAAINSIWDGINMDILTREVKEELEALPPVTPQPKVGHWINAKVGKLFPSNDFKCSNCGNILDFDGVNCGRGDANYCPNCGAKMVEPQESEE